MPDMSGCSRKARTTSDSRAAGSSACGATSPSPEGPQSHMGAEIDAADAPALTRGRWPPYCPSGQRVAPFILRAIRIVIRADSDPVRQALFANLKQSHLSVRLVFGLHEHLGRTRASALLVSCYGRASFLRIAPPTNPAARILTVARHAHAQRHVGRVASWLESGECAPLRARLSARAGSSGVAVLLRGSSRIPFVRAFRIVRTID